jgi:N,N'-diacetyllegionaminate synthase
MTTLNIEISGCHIGLGNPCFIIAEAGVNHNGDLALARQLVDAAKAAGADAVKFQTFRAERLVTAQAPKADYQKQTTLETESQLTMLKRLELTHAMHVDLIAYCRDCGILFLSTPFEEDSADELIALGLKLLKLPSGEITNFPFLRHVALKQIPVILSTGMASLGEVEQAVEIFRDVGNSKLILLHCVSNYPADPSDCNLRAMRTLRAAFELPVGFSDHTPGISVALAAVALGACVIEKHFTLDRALPGPDHQASLEPDELAALVRGIRIVESALGDGRKACRGSERNTAEIARKSIVAACEIPPGTVITNEMLVMLRPGTGLPASMLQIIAGRKARKSISAGSLLSFDLLV